MCAVVSSVLPQTHVVSLVWNFHFFLCAQTVAASLRES